MKQKKQRLSSVNPIAPKEETLVKEFVGGVDADKLYSEIAGPITDSANSRGTWEQKRDTYYRMRMRIRRDKSFPFPGCSNLRLPTVEKYIRKHKAYLYNMVFGITPHAMVMPEPKGSFDVAFKLELYLDWLIDTKLKLSKPLSILIDKMDEKGFAFTEVIWKIQDEPRRFEVDLKDLPQEIVQQVFADTEDQTLVESLMEIFEIDKSSTVKLENEEAVKGLVQTLRSGQPKATLTVKDETYNNVAVNVFDPQYVFAPVDSGLNVQDARWVAVETYEPWSSVKQKAKDGIYSQEAVKSMTDTLMNAVPSEGRSSNTAQNTTPAEQDLREGIDRIVNASKSVKLWRVYAWYDLDGDGVEERNVFIVAPEWHKVLAAFPFTYAHRKWPVIRFDYEAIDDRWFSSRGIPEMLEDIVKEIDTQHNQKIDQQTIRNTPMFAFRPGLTNPRLVKFIPGQAIPVQGTSPLDDALKVISSENLNVEFSYKDEEMLLKGEIQELLGQVDYTLQSQINRRQPRTASESMAQAQSANLLSSYEAALFADSMSEMFTQIVQLTQQYLPEEVYFSVVGEKAQVRLSRDEIQGQYIVKVRGNDANMNPVKRLEMAQAKIAMLANPIFIQTGIVTPVNFYVLLKEYLQETGDFSWQMKISQPLPPPPPSPPPAIENVKVSYNELAPGERAQVLQSAGINPDFEGQALQKMQEINENNPKEPEGEPTV